MHLNSGKSFSEMGVSFGRSGERVRQIYTIAFEKVRAYVNAKNRKDPAQTSIKSVVAKNGKSQPMSLAATMAPSPIVKPRPYRLKMRAMEKNPNHHIWNNNGTWFCKFVLILANGERSKISNSLDTKDVELARHKRDVLIRLYNSFTA